MPAVIAFALVLAVVFGIVGYVGGATSASDLVSDLPVWGGVLSDLSERGGVGAGGGALLGIAAGLVTGGLIGLVLPWLSAYAEDPVVAVLVALLQVIIGIAVGLTYVLYAVALEPLRLRLAGARRLSRREEKLLLPVLHECAQRMGLPNVPRVLVDDTRKANALAYTRHIVVTRGLLDEFDYDRKVLAGILSHELTHWRNADHLAALFVRGVALPLYLPYVAATWVMRVFDNSILRFLAGAVAWPIAATVRFVVVPMQAAGSRAAEYRADQGAVLAGQVGGLRQALERFRRSFDGNRNGWDAAVCASHPPNELRLEHLEQPGEHYSLPGSQANADRPTEGSGRA